MLCGNVGIALLSMFRGRERLRRGCLRLARQPHIRNKPRREALAGRFRDSDDSFKAAIVRDMWLTGFDAPSLHTLYVDKPMRGHGLMQAIARVNRVFKDKPGGLVVDYLGLANELRQALPSLRAGRAARRSDGYPRRCGVLSSRAGRARQTLRGRGRVPMRNWITPRGKSLTVPWPRRA